MAGFRLTRPPRQRYTPDEKAALTQQARQLVLATGLPVPQVAERLGLHPTTLYTWLRQDKTGDFRPVVLAPSTLDLVPVVPDAPPPMPVVVTPTGYRIEGLDVAGVAELLRRLS